MARRHVAFSVLGLALVACAGSRRSQGAVAAAPPAVAPTPAPARSTPAPEPSPPAAADTFATTVQPILVAGCMPCHFPGGKMYDRLPFDDGAVVAAHPEGVLRRIKDPEKKQTIERWLAAAAGLH